MQPSDVLLRGRPVDRRPALFVAVLGALTVAAALAVPSPLLVRLPAIVVPVAVATAALAASRATNVVIRTGPVVYVRDSRTARLVPAPRDARIVFTRAHDPNVLLLDAQGRMLAGASVRCAAENVRARLAPAGIPIEVW